MESIVKKRIARGDFTGSRVIGRYGLNVMASQNHSGDTSHPANPPVSVILTVINEAAHLRAAVSAALNSNYAGELEVVIAVGPSRDQTLDIAHEISSRESRVKVISNPSGKTPSGLNAALRAAKFEIIVRIDGHSEIDSDYIRKAVATLNETGAVNVGGIMAAEGITTFQCAVARAMRSPIGVGGARFHVGGKAGPTDTVYLGVFRRNALERVGGYDENFVRAQDWEMNYRLRANGGTIWFNPELKVTYRPRSSLRALAKQYFEYGRWRRAVSRHHKGTMNFRYLAPPLNLIVNALSLALGVVVSPLFFIAIATYLAAIFLASLSIGKNLGERIRLPIILITMHFCWGFGFISSPSSLIPR
jgi:glycosyltransferase involved in cell wall biosynthesis